jgi:hypothetical protein
MRMKVKATTETPKNVGSSSAILVNRKRNIQVWMPEGIPGFRISSRQAGAEECVELTEGYFRSTP